MDMIINFKVNKKATDLKQGDKMKEFCKVMVSSLIVFYVMITVCLWSTANVEVWPDGEKRYGNWGRRVTLVEVFEIQKEWLKGYKIK